MCSWATALMVLALFSTSAWAADALDPDALLTGAGGFLTNRQQADGSWSDRTWHTVPPALPADDGMRPASALLGTSLAIQVQLFTGNRASAMRGLAWLRQQQGDDGAIGATNTEQAFATRAFLEGLFAGEATYEEPARRGLALLAQRQRQPLCWPEHPQDQDVIDTTASFWCQQTTLAMVPWGRGTDTISGAWQERNPGHIATPQSNGGRIISSSFFPARILTSPLGGFSLDAKAGDSSAAGLYLLNLTRGVDDQPDILRSLTSTVVGEFAVQDDRPIDWRRLYIAWNALPRKPYLRLPAPNQERLKLLLRVGYHADGPLAGSWDPPTTSDQPGGRITSTCFAALTAWSIRNNPMNDTSSIDKALEFLVRSQQEDGSWDVAALARSCPAMAISPENLAAAPGTVTMTGLSVLGFLGAGYDHKTPNKYKTRVDRGLRWLMSTQQQDGSWKGAVVDHANAVMALAEAYAMTNDPDLKGPAQRGLNALLKRRVTVRDQGPIGWPIQDGDHLIDSWTTSIGILAMKSGMAGGLNVGSSLADARRWWEIAFAAANGDPTIPTTGFPRALLESGAHPTGDPCDAELHGLVAIIMIGEDKNSLTQTRLARAAFERARTLSAAGRCPPHQHWHAGLSFFQRGGLEWRQWAVLSRAAPDPIYAEECTKGALPPPAALAPSFDLLTSTIYRLLELEIQYRMAHVGQDGR